MEYYIDNVKVQNNTMVILGWAAGEKPDMPVRIRIQDQKGNEVLFHRSDSGRYDVNQELFQGKSSLKLGFCIIAEYKPENLYYIVFETNGKQKKEKISFKEQGNLGKALAFFKRYGLKPFLKKVRKKLFGNKVNYEKWQKQVIPGKGELDRQRQQQFEIMPVFSIVVPLYKTPESQLREMIDSVRAQTYVKWELCLADGSGDNGNALRSIVEEYTQADNRIHYAALTENLGISGNTNQAIGMANGDYIAFLDHDDLLTEDALYECVVCINKENDLGKVADLIYSDEDKVVVKNGKKRYITPHFKPDFNPDLLRSVNYITHFLVVKKELLDEVGGFQTEFDGAQDYDFVFRCTEKAHDICHIPRVLYHWRVSRSSTAGDPRQKTYAFVAGERAIKAHCERLGLGNVQIEKNEVWGSYRVKYPLQDTPLISVIIPNKDHRNDLEICLRSLFKQSYKNVEILIAENNSTEEATFEFYKELEKSHKNVQVVQWNKGRDFNFSAINNSACSHAKGEYFLFLNNDTEFINPDCIEEMLSFCQRDDVGAVGAELFYKDDTIQHAGVIVGYGGVAGHAFVGFHKGEKTYFLRASSVQNYSAVTAACMMTKASVFWEVGGFDEDFAVAFNDIDYCMKVRTLKKLIVYDPFAQLYHYESKSRGVEDSPERVQRFEKEVERFRSKWPEILRDGDPYYNPNLTLLSSDFSLKDFKRE